MHRLVKNYSLSITLTALFVLSWVGQYYFQYQQFVSEQLQHGQQAEISQYLPEFLAATFENWQSEFLQLLTFVVLTSFLIHKGSHESKDSEEAMQRDIREIKELLKRKK